MIYRVFMTADRVTPESAGEGAAEEHGWVDPSSTRTLHSSRNDVAPVAEYNPGSEYDVEQWPTVADWIRATVAEHLGAAESNGDGTWYGQGSDEDLRTGDSYRRALHFHGKTYAHGRWVEADLLDDGTWYVGAGVYATHEGGKYRVKRLEIDEMAD